MCRWQERTYICMYVCMYCMHENVYVHNCVNTFSLALFYSEFAFFFTTQQPFLSLSTLSSSTCCATANISLSLPAVNVFWNKTFWWRLVIGETEYYTKKAFFHKMWNRFEQSKFYLLFWKKNEISFLLASGKEKFAAPGASGVPARGFLRRKICLKQIRPYSKSRSAAILLCLPPSARHTNMN